MIWIATLCLLAIAAWLIFNALNEKRWVEAHSHDETVAADKGILPDLSKITASLRTGEDGKMSIDQENTPFARTVSKVREKTAKASEWVEKKTAEGRDRDEGETYFGRAVAKIGGFATQLDDKLDARTKRMASESAEKDRASGATNASEEGLMGRVFARVERTLGTKTMQDRPSNTGKSSVDKQPDRQSDRQSEVDRPD